MVLGERNDAGSNPADCKDAPSALTTTKETLAPLDARKRETLAALANKLR